MKRLLKDWRTYALAACVIGLGILSACGGGGGGGAPSGGTGGGTTTVAGTLAVQTCDVPIGGTTCSGAATYATTAGTPSAPSLEVNGVRVSALTSGTNVAITLNLGANTVVYKDGSTVVAGPVMLTTTCAPGSAANGSTCQAQNMAFTQAFAVFGDTLAKLVNDVPVPMSNTTTLGNPRCDAVPEDAIAYGKILTLCYADDGNVHYAQYDVQNNRLEATSVTSATAPAGYELTQTGPSNWTFGSKWHRCQANCQLLTGNWGTPPFSGWTSWTIEDGGYLFTDSNPRALQKRSASGAISTTFTSTNGLGFTVLETMVCTSSGQCTLHTAN